MRWNDPIHKTIWYRILQILLLLAVIGLAMQTIGGMFSPAPFDTIVSIARAADGQTDIEWFRDQMKISDKYLEYEEGVLGMSWTHFLTMVILILFAAGAFAAFILRYRRTQAILDEIRKEK